MIIGALAFAWVDILRSKVHGKINAVDVENQGKRSVNFPVLTRAQSPDRRVWSGLGAFSEDAPWTYLRFLERVWNQCWPHGFSVLAGIASGSNCAKHLI
jgi:hypothetical protein